MDTNTKNLTIQSIISSEDGFKEVFGDIVSESEYNGSLRGASHERGMQGIEKIYLECVYGHLVN